VHTCFLIANYGFKKKKNYILLRTYYCLHFEDEPFIIVLGNICGTLNS